MTKKSRQPLRVCFMGTYDPEYTSNKLILKGLRVNQVEVFEVNYPITVTRLDKQQDMTWLKLLKRIAQKVGMVGVILNQWSAIRQTDVIYVGYPGHFDVLYAVIVARLLQKKLVFNPLLLISVGFIEEQGILKRRSLLARVMTWLEGMVYRSCDLVFADTPFQAEIMKKEFHVQPEKLKVLAIGADDEYYHYTPYQNQQKKLNVTYYGLYSPIHGVEYLVEAARLLKNDPDISFVMVGNGNTFEKNYQKAQELQLSQMTFYHDTPLSEHPAIIAKADVFLGFLTNHPTVERVIPNKVYQGLALAKIVLTADAPVIRSVFQDRENIWMVKPEDPKRLAAALKELKEKPELRAKIAQAGYQLFKEQYSPAAVGKELKRFLGEIL